MINPSLCISDLGLSYCISPLALWNLSSIEHSKVGERLSARGLCSSLITYTGDEYKCLIGMSTVKGLSLLLYHKRTSVFGSIQYPVQGS